MELNLSGKVAVITGGSKGIGLAVARELASEGTHIALCSRHGDEARDAAAGKISVCAPSASPWM